MVYIYNRFSPNEASTPNSNVNTSASQTSTANQAQKRPAKYQSQQPPRGYPMTTMSITAFPQRPPLYPPASGAPAQFGPAGSESPQFFPEGNASGQHLFGGGPPRYQHPGTYNSPPYCPPMSFQQGPHPMQQMQPPMEFMPPQVMYGGPSQYAMPPMHNQEGNIMPFNGTVPPPGFEPNMVYNGQNVNYQYDSRCTPSPSFAGCAFNTQMPPDSPHFPTIPMQPFPLFIPSQKLPNQRRPKAIAIIDPATGEDKLNEIYGASKSDESDNMKDYENANDDNTGDSE